MQVFADVNDIQVDKEQLSQPVSKDAVPIAKGGFGIVYKRTLHTQVRYAANGDEYRFVGGNGSTL